MPQRNKHKTCLHKNLDRNVVQFVYTGVMVRKDNRPRDTGWKIKSLKRSDEVLGVAEVSGKRMKRI
jgi:hypothetical protein